MAFRSDGRRKRTGAGGNRSELNEGQLDRLKINLIVRLAKTEVAQHNGDNISRHARELIYIYAHSFISLETHPLLSRLYRFLRFFGQTSALSNVIVALDG